MENTSAPTETPEWQGYYNTANFLSSSNETTVPSAGPFPEWENSDQQNTYVCYDESVTASGVGAGGTTVVTQGTVTQGVTPAPTTTSAAATAASYQSYYPRPTAEHYPQDNATTDYTQFQPQEDGTSPYPQSYYLPEGRNNTNNTPYIQQQPISPLFFEFNSVQRQLGGFNYQSIPPIIKPIPPTRNSSYPSLEQTRNSTYPSLEPKTCGGTSPPIKRPRGRPRKHPLPINHPEPQNVVVPLMVETEGLADVASVDRISRAERALRLRKELYSDAVIRELAKLDEHATKTTSSDVAEEYHGYGGPFAVMEAAFNVQQLEEQQQPKTLDALIDSCRPFRANGIHLNTTAMWASLNPRVPVRDLAVSRAHMAALLNDGTVYVYRHKTTTLVRTRVSQWEKIEGLSDVGVVSVRLASACLPPNWREQYHQIKRRELIEKLRIQLKDDPNAPNVPHSSDAPDSTDAPDRPLQTTGEPTEEELRFFIKKSPKGFLTLPYSRIDPDWLPDPVILASVDSNGIVRFSKCGGYYNYPILTPIVESSVESTTIVESSADSSIDKENNQPDEQVSLDEIVNNNSNIIVIDGQQYKVTRNRTAMDRTDRQAELSVVKRVSQSGQAGERVKAHVVDVALGEITMASLIGVHNAPELSMVLYAVAPDQELSAFVKGKGIYIRFKNFPTGPAKMHCGPLGHTGVVLLANGTVWQWNATNEGSRISVSINQVAGSLKGKAVVDLLGTGADYFALTGDGIVHEWNARKSYINTNHLLYSLDGHDKLDIPEPIEWTPKFKEDLIIESGRSISTLPSYAKGQFSWFLKSDKKVVGDLTAQTTTGGSMVGRQGGGQGQDGGQGQGQNENQSGGQGQNENHNGGQGQSESEGPRSGQADGPSVPSIGIILTEGGFEPHTAQEAVHIAESPKPNSTTSRTHPPTTPPTANTLLENELEEKRLCEIESRYVTNPTSQENMKVERLFVCDGISFLFRPYTTRRIYVELNDLGNWSVVSLSSESWVKQSPMSLRPKLSDGPFSTRQLSWTDACNAAHQARLYGKPLLTNPVIVARYRLTASGMKDQQLRSLLESMALSNPPCYRLITAPNYLILAILRMASINNLHRVCLTTRMPLMLVSDDPSRYAETLFGNSILTPILSDLSENDKIYRRSSTSCTTRGRRVGRPRGSRAATRTALSTRQSDDTIDHNDQRIGAAAGTRKRNRRLSDEDPVQWKQILQFLDTDNDDDDENGKRGKRSRRKKNSDEPYHPESVAQ